MNCGPQLRRAARRNPAVVAAVLGLDANRIRFPEEESPMRSTAVLFVVGALLVASATASAHHGYGGFFDPKDRTVAVEGDLLSLLYGNPHVVMRSALPIRASTR
jgi:hypothetical protein